MYYLIISLIVLTGIIGFLLENREIREKINNILFRKERETEKWVLLCPECGSVDWKFPEPLKVANHFFNLPSMVNNFYECKDCGNIGMFIEVSQRKYEKEKKEIIVKEKVKKEEKIPFFLAVTIFLIGYFLVGLLSTTLAIMFCLGLYKYLRNKRKNK